MCSTSRGWPSTRASQPGKKLCKVLLRAFAFISCGCIVLARLPVRARETGGGPLAYGLLFGSLGLGAVAGHAPFPG